MFIDENSKIFHTVVFRFGYILSEFSKSFSEKAKFKVKRRI